MLIIGIWNELFEKLRLKPTLFPGHAERENFIL